jgi:proteasome assembly chaperone (PAC2) family protein
MENGEGQRPGLEHLRWIEQPALTNPVVLAGFGGWSDAGDSATAALSFLAEQWDGKVFAEIDPEVFYDFTSTRPLVQFDNTGQRELVWPQNEFIAATIPGTSTDVIILRGEEPQLRWRTYCENVTAIARYYGAQRVLTLGSLLAEVPHTRPVSVFGAGADDDVSLDLGLLPSHYEGPTGITGVLQVMCRESGIATAGLWAAVPTYVPSSPSPKAALALVRHAARILDVSDQLDLSDLEAATVLYEREVTELVEDDDETEQYVELLEQRYDEEGANLLDDGSNLIDEVERFLRGQH